MIRYSKGSAPTVLTTLAAARPRRAWNDLRRDDRDPIRSALVRDQGWLCAYCQSRIRPDDSAAGISRMKIEHWNARNPEPGAGSDDVDQQFLWSNLLGVCPGMSLDLPDSRNRSTSHCDTSRGNVDLFLHPVEGRGPDPREHLQYTRDGRVVSATPDDRVERDIQALNLNASHLVRARKAVFDKAWKELERARFTIGQLRRLERIHSIAAGMTAPEHAEFVRYHILKKMRSLGYVP
jgi:uncharacterized protein (TIGR02646 family)